MMFDAIVIGGGPAGLSAAIYASRYNMKVLLLTDLIGGVITTSVEVENYPGTIKATGMQLMEEWKKHAEMFGAEIKQERASDIEKKGKIFVVTTTKQKYEAKTILFATGAKHRPLGVPGEEEFFGRGVSTCATCDGIFFKDKTVAVVGGGDAALRGAQVMLDIASKVYLIHRRDEFRGEPILVDKVKKNPKLELVLKRTIKELKGDKKLNEIILDNGKSLKVDGVFIEVGSVPNTELAEKMGVKLDDGLIKVDKSQSTNIGGVFAAGDVTTASNAFRQIITAASEGAIAAESMFTYCKDNC